MRLLLRAFPPGFRRRYGTELLELARGSGRPVRDGIDIVRAGLRERVACASRRVGARARRAEPAVGISARALAGGALAVGVIAAATGSVALGGCIALGSAAAAGALVLAAGPGRSALRPAS